MKRLNFAQMTTLFCLSFATLPLQLHAATCGGAWEDDFDIDQGQIDKELPAASQCECVYQNPNPLITYYNPSSVSGQTICVGPLVTGNITGGNPARLHRNDTSRASDYNGAHLFSWETRSTVSVRKLSYTAFTFPFNKIFPVDSPEDCNVQRFPLAVVTPPATDPNTGFCTGATINGTIPIGTTTWPSAVDIRSGADLGRVIPATPWVDGQPILPVSCAIRGGVN
jgi:hypothetical protein